MVFFREKFVAAQARLVRAPQSHARCKESAGRIPPLRLRFGDQRCNAAEQSWHLQTNAASAKAAPARGGCIPLSRRHSPIENAARCTNGRNTKAAPQRSTMKPMAGVGRSFWPMSRIPRTLSMAGTRPSWPSWNAEARRSPQAEPSLSFRSTSRTWFTMRRIISGRVGQSGACPHKASIAAKVSR